MSGIGHLADIDLDAVHVRLGLIADIPDPLADVR